MHQADGPLAGAQAAAQDGDRVLIPSSVGICAAEGIQALRGLLLRRAERACLTLAERGEADCQVLAGLPRVPFCRDGRDRLRSAWA
ncbi:MAG: hypothetical protein ABJB47_06055 [Actinomycetota bacterium]